MIQKDKFNNNSDDEQYPKVVYSAENKNGSKIKQFLSLNFFVGVLFASPLFIGYLLYKIIWKRDIKALVVMISTILHSAFIAQPNKYFSKFYEKMETLKWFDKFEIIAEEKIDKKKVLFSWMPHSILCFPAHFSRYNQKSPFYHSLLMGSRMAIKAPVIGSFFQWNGTTGADPTNFKKCMSTGKNIVFLPGGFEEASVSSNKEYRLWINDRKGFIKYAMQFGYKVHPVFTFNETKGYATSDFAMDFRMWLNKFKLPGTLFFSKQGLLPENNIEVAVVIGKKIDIPQIDNPTQDQIDEYHMKYIMEVKELFNRHVDKYDPGAQLKFWGSEKPKPKL